MGDYTFLFVSYDGVFTGSAIRTKKEGFKTYMYLPTRYEVKGDETAQGFLDKDEIVDDPFKVINKVPKDKLIILVDDNGHGSIFDHLRKEGYICLGGSDWADEIEYDRMKGTQLMQSIGLVTPETHPFKNLSEGIKFLDSQKPDTKFVFKPNGSEWGGGNMTYTGKNVEDLKQFMEWVKEDANVKHYVIGEYELQSFIEGYEADISFYFDGNDVVEGSVNLYIEEKKAGDGNLGQAMGSMGAVIVFLKDSKYYREYLSKLIPILREKKYVGQIAINNIFSKKDGKPYGLEFTPRFGWDSHPIEVALIEANGQKVSDFYLAQAGIKKVKFPTDMVGIGVRVCCGAPGWGREQVDGRRFTVGEDIEGKLYYYAVSYQDKSLTCENNEVLIATDTAPTIKKVLDNIYNKVIPEIYMPDIYYRKEIGERASEVMLFLHNKGWI